MALQSVKFLYKLASDDINDGCLWWNTWLLTEIVNRNPYIQIPLLFSYHPSSTPLTHLSYFLLRLSDKSVEQTFQPFFKETQCYCDCFFITYNGLYKIQCKCSQGAIATMIINLTKPIFRNQIAVAIPSCEQAFMFSHVPGIFCSHLYFEVSSCDIDKASLACHLTTNKPNTGVASESLRINRSKLYWRQ